MRSRTLREGTVGLLLLLGVGVFGGLIMWLNRVTAARSSYKAIVEFANAGGMQKGAVVRYRGVRVGRISDIRPQPNAVEVEIEIFQPQLQIPNDAVIEANQSGLISESIIDITPRKSLPSGVAIAKPLERNCDRNLIVCNGSRLKGQIGISLDELIRSSTQLATTYSDEQFYKNVNKLVENSSVAAANVAELSRNLNTVSKSFQKEIGSVSATANTLQNATTEISKSSTQTAKEISLTANQANRLLKNLDQLVTTNRSSLVSALNSITETSNQLRVTVGGLSPTVKRLNQGELVKNLETLSANAAQASANLRDVSKSLSDPNNVMVLQQTLDSARVTFENTQKITSDLDELTGDPTFRENLRQLVNGLSGLVSSTQDMEQQVQVATTLDSLKAAVNNRKVDTYSPQISQKQKIFHLSVETLQSASKTKSLTKVNPAISFPRQESLLRRLRQYHKQRQSQASSDFTTNDY